MADKTFYQAAASEVAGGVVDQALWIKVTADMAGADKVTRQAKYIQLRAQELAAESLKLRAKSWLPRTKWQWFFYVALSIAVSYGLAASMKMGPLGTTPVPLLLFVAVPIAAVIFAKKSRSR